MAVKNKKKGISKFRAAVTANAKQQRTQGSAYGYLNLPRGVNVFKEPSEGRILVDFLPYTVSEPKHPDRNDEVGIAVLGELWYKRPFKIHRNVGAKNEAVVCLQSIGKRCPICDFRAQRVKEGAEDEELKALKPSNRNLYVIVPRGQKDHEEKPHVWDISQFLFQAKLNEELEENDEMGIFPDPEDGMSLKIRFAEQAIGKNKYGECSRIDFISRKAPIDDDLLNAVPDLDKMLKIYTYEELEKLFLELDEEETPAATSARADIDKASAKREKKQSVEADDDDDDDDSEEDADDDDSEKDEADDSEDEDDDEDDSESDEDDETDDDDSESDEDDDDDEDDDAPEETATCVACKGTGKNSKGRMCVPCQGTGKAQPKPTEGKVAPTAGKTTQKQPAQPTKPTKDKDKDKVKGKCPHGHKYGKDCEDFEECDTCEHWSECIDAKES